MPLLNTVKIEGDDARAALEEEESLLALSPAAVAYGVTHGAPGVEPDVDAVDARVSRAVAGIAGGRENKPGRLRKIVLAPLSLFGAGPALDPGVFPQSWIGGRTCAGPRGSAARDMQAHIKNNSDSWVAVTEERLLLLTRSGAKGPMSVAWVLPRSTVATARRRPRLFARARFELRFVDGSWIIVSACPPHIGSWHGKQVVNALSR